MKNYVLTTKLLLFSVFFLFSCENNNVSEIISNDKSQINYRNLYEQIISVGDLNEQLLIANSLDANEKFNMWQIKLDNFIANNNLNNDQIEFITELKERITIELFQNKKIREYFNMHEKNKLMSKSMQLFGENLGYYLLTKFENTNQTLDKLDINNDKVNISIMGPEQAISACDCTKDSNCRRLTGVSIWGFSWENGRCSEDSCYRETVHVFGYTLWESSDNGKCEY